MSKFTPTVSYKVEFEGDTVEMTLARLKRADMQKLSPYMAMEGDDTKIRFEDQMQFSNLTLDLLPNYVSNFRGLMDANGNELKLEDVLGEVYFTSLFQDVVVKIFEISRLGAEEAKNLDAPSGGGLEG